jgi:hypothetical protein
MAVFIAILNYPAVAMAGKQTLISVPLSTRLSTVMEPL